MLYIISKTGTVEKKQMKKPGFKLTLKSFNEPVLIFEVDITLYEFNLETLQFSKSALEDGEENGWYAGGKFYYQE